MRRFEPFCLDITVQSWSEGAREFRHSIVNSRHIVDRSARPYRVFKDIYIQRRFAKYVEMQMFSSSSRPTLVPSPPIVKKQWNYLILFTTGGCPLLRLCEIWFATNFFFEQIISSYMLPKPQMIIISVPRSHRYTINKSNCKPSSIFLI